MGRGSPPPAGVAPIGQPAGGFAIDGDLIANTPNSGAGDWVAWTNSPGTGTGVLKSDGTPINPTTTFHFVDPYNSSSDLTFGGGNKWTDNPGSWSWVTGKPSGKTDINNVLLHIGNDTNGHIWLVIAADRASTSGDSYIDFEFLQNALARTNGGAFVTSGPDGGRTKHDLLLSLAFTGGGGVADFFAWHWEPDGAGGFAYQDITTNTIGIAFAALNSNTVPVPYSAFGQTTYGPNAFAEAALDLTALLGGFDQCTSYGFKTIMVKTKTSQSPTATIVDFIDPIQYSLKIGPSADAGPDQTRCTEGAQTAFPLSGIATAGLNPIASTTWSVANGSAIIDSPTSLVTTAYVSSASATLRLIVTQVNGCSETNDVALNVSPLPVCSIVGPTLVCPRSSVQFHAPSGMSGYAWSISGNASISGATNGQNVTINAGNACNASFTLSLAVVSNNCSSTCSTDVLVNDTTAPSLVLPPNKVLECPADTRTNATGVAVAQDDCGQVALSYTDIVTNLCANTKVIARVWTATDLCGNTTNSTQTITVQDTIKPSIICPPNKTLECPSDTSTNNTGIATATDGCGAVSISYSDSVSNTCGGGMVISRLWTATDLCGNSASCVQTILLRDTTRPSLVCPPSLTLDCPADTSTNNTGVAIAQDTCSSVTVSYSDSVTNNCGPTKVIARTWTAVDDCGNSTNSVQLITVRDISKPTITCPPDRTLECPADTSTNNTGVATAQDTCSQVTIRYSDSVSNSCGGTKVIARTWTATDACSNSASCVQTIIVRDSTPPSISCPPDLTLECPANTATNATGVATASDGCGAVTVRYSDVVATNCPGTKVISRTWTATDTCGNLASCVQTITVRDTLKPTLSCPPDVILECPANTSTNATGVATATDGCSKVTVTFNDQVNTNCGATKVISRTWTAVDECGNSTSCTQTITVRDTIKPTITCPPSLTLDCPADTRTNNTGVATAQDGCSQTTISYSDSITNACAGTKTIARTWTATDACGNSASCVQTIIVRDITPPTITCPSNVVLECPANTSTNNTGVATAQDGCGSVAVTYADVVTNLCGGTKIISRLWTATDLCGNSASCVQTITVRDTTPPTITCPPNALLECPANTGTNATGVATAQDGCGSVTITYSDAVTNNCAQTKVIARTWTATDACGNVARCVQTITVRDTIKPTLVRPPDVTLECPATDTTTNVTGSATATDGCSAVTITYTDVVTPGCGLTKSVARTWTATDQCGNSTSALQTITVRDTTKPSLVCPANVTLECPANTTTNNTGVAVAMDACGSTTVRYSDAITTTCGSAKVISRTWTATDACGNTASCIQTITVKDTTSPTITCPPSLTLECGASTSPSATGTATAQDTCNSVNVSYSDSVSNICGGSRVISRTWLATDDCGNSASCLQTITVIDTTPPSLRLPANATLQCPGDTRTNVTGVPVTQDACGSVTVSYSDVITNGCGSTRTVLRLWTATDSCGNSTNGLQTIVVQDTTKPSIVCPKISVQCVADLPAAYTSLSAFLSAGGTATDSCSAALAFSLISDSGLVGRCPGTVTRVYRVSDACGNYADGTQTITVDDTIPPVITCPPNVTVECGLSLEPENTGLASATDNCSTNVTITHSDVVVQGQYDLKFYVADPDTGTGPYSPTYLKFAPGSLPCPESARLTGRALDPLRNAVAYSTNGQLDALTSIGNVPMAFGQIVPYEVVIQASGGPGPERGTIDFTATWSTYTTSNDRFGYDTNYMVYCAFVDAADPGTIDPNYNARVESYSSTVINRGSIDEQIQGTFRVSGLDAGDRVVVEIWVVLMPTMQDHAGGTVSASLVSAQTAANPAVPISIGNQTDSLGNLSKIFPMPPPSQQPPLGPLPQQPPALPGSTVNVIDRTWVAVDDCGNPSSCVQRITVRDTTPPVITVSDVVLDCPALDTSTNVTGMAVAQDACGSVKLYYSDSVSNGCGGTRIISRLWTATDDAGNSTNQVQTITVQDTPKITCPPDLVLECSANTTTNNTGAATAQDSCSSVTVSYSDSFSNSCGSAGVILRTWVARNACGNTAQCVQTLTLRDTIPPTLTCQPDRSVAAGVPWTFDTPTATDSCGSATLQVLNTVTNHVSTNLVVTRTWVATDACGNTNLCHQTITTALGVAPTIVAQPISQTVTYSNNLSLRVGVTGTTPMSYQWRLNGTNIAGATRSTLNVSQIGFNEGGLYNVLVTNVAGSVMSANAVVNVAPRILAQYNAGTFTLTWPAPFILQSATNVTGPYLDVPGATSPFVRNTSLYPQEFFRLRSGSIILTPLSLANGKFALSCPGVLGCNFVVQGSTNLVNWVNLGTNCSPFTFVDPNAGQHPSCFYRAVLAH